MTDDLPPGPAFIQWRAGMSELPWLVSDGEIARDRHSVPPGYVWQPATIGTAAGWVRGGVGLAGFAHDLAVRQQALGGDFAKVLHDNLWDLYERSP